MCVDDTHVRKLAADAFEWQKIGCPMPGSAGREIFMCVYGINRVKS